MKTLQLSLLAIFLIACGSTEPGINNQDNIRFERISYFKDLPNGNSKPFKYLLTYYFDNGKPHRWLELDSLAKPLIDYIYEYDANWNHIGAKYKEPGETEYAVEKVRFVNDSTKVTEWIDSVGNVFYKMTDNLNSDGDTYRATFEGDAVHGYDSTFYTEEGFPERIFFTNIKGKVFNDRTFEYDSLDVNGDWVSRVKIMEGEVQEYHAREIYYDSSFTTREGIYYQGILSSGDWSENSLSFSRKEDVVFQTRTTGWEKQLGFIARKTNGLFTESLRIDFLDTIYNGALSPDGNKLIYSVKSQGLEQVWLLKNLNGEPLMPVNLTNSSKIEGGYFYWLNETELFFQSPKNNGDIIHGKLEGEMLSITDPLSKLNTAAGTEFSPFVDKEKRFLIFTKYLEGDISQQGFFVSYNTGSFETPVWSAPEKLTMLPYGWNACIINNGSQFLYTNGDDVISIPMAELKLKI